MRIVKGISRGGLWKPTWIKQGDGAGGWVLQPARIQFLHYGAGVSGKETHHGGSTLRHFIPFGVQQMDTGEIALIGAFENADERGWPHNQTPVITFSQDRGDTWEPLRAVDESVGGSP